MALRGTIDVNGNGILAWEALRLEPLNDAGTEYTYKVTVSTVGGKQWTDQIVHTYSDGAAVLAAKVLMTFHAFVEA